MDLKHRLVDRNRKEAIKRKNTRQRKGEISQLRDVKVKILAAKTS
jgi:hypothetical protein